MAIKVTTLLSQALIKENGSQQEASNYPFSVSWVVRAAEERFIHQNLANVKRPSSRPLVARSGTAAPGTQTVQSVKKKREKKRNSEGITYYFKLFLDRRDQIPLKPR